MLRICSPTKCLLAVPDRMNLNVTFCLRVMYKCANNAFFARNLSLRQDARFKYQMEWLSKLKEMSPSLPKNVFVVSNVTGSGINEFKAELLKVSLTVMKTIGINSGLKMPLSAGLLMLHDELVILRKNGTLLMNWDEMQELAMNERFEMKNEDNLKAEMKTLQDIVSVLYEIRIYRYMKI